MFQTRDSGADDRSQILHAEGLGKVYGARTALKNLSFSLQAGRVVGFLGPNGAGKTTSIRILTTILQPSSGHFVVDGISSDHPEEIRRRIGVLPEGLGFPRQLTGLRYLTYYGELFGRATAEARAVADQLLDEVGLKARAQSPIGSYSHGMRQRLGIARALVNDPAVVFFDEPTLGLDPRGQRELLGLIQAVARQRHKGVVLSSHLLSEIEGVCDDVVIMNAGEVVAKGSVADVIGQGGHDPIAVRVRVPVSALDTARGLIEALPSVRAAVPADDGSGWLGVQLVPENGSSDPGPRTVNRILETLIAADVPIAGVDSGANRLEDVFLRLTTETIQ
jgi:ABC-2 type transport system ATP-binding protein